MKNWEIMQDDMRRNLAAVDMLPLAMAYVPMQRYENTYEISKWKTRNKLYNTRKCYNNK